LTLAAVVSAALVVVAVPGAVNPSKVATFEVDGDAYATSASSDDDWNCIFGTATNCQDPPTPVASTHVTDPVGDNDDDILAGGSKDILPVAQWTRALQKPPAKDDIMNAAWASYSVDVAAGPPHDIVYFTADRISNNGDAFMGFWFFKNRISVNADGSFSGLHSVGDTLILVNFIQGNAQQTDTQEIGVFKWVGTGGDVNGTLQTIVPITEGTCATSIGTTDACAQFNTDSIPSLFPFQSTDSHDPANTYTKSEFVEGGIDLTALLQGDDCFSTVMAETRSSSSVTAEQKDIALGELNTCGTVVIKKDAVPNDAQDFGFHQGTGDALSPSTFLLDDDAGADATLSNTQTYTLVKPGEYTIVEEANPTGWNLSAISCDDPSLTPSSGDPGTRTATINVSRNETVTCTFTNTKAPKLTVNKVCQPANDGGKFNLRIDGQVVTPNAACGTGTGAQTTTVGAHSVSETAGTGTDLSSYTSVTGGDCDANGNVTLAAGDSKVCTITNTRFPQLHLRKVVINDNGGTKTAADFPLTANGAGSNDLTGTSPVDSDSTLQPDTWTLSETAQAGYTASAWSCVGGNQSGNQITLGYGQEATCTITNDDIAPKLHLRKVVVNDNGGTKTVNDFTLTAAGAKANNDLSGTSPVDSGAGLKADTWTLSETTLAAYDASAWVCVGGTQDGDKITVGIAGEATCTITNDDIAPTLHLRKVVVNDNGGTKTAADFTLTADGAGSNDLGGQSPVDSDESLRADTWTLSETTLAGYAASAWDCVGGTQVGNQITLGLAGEATCTITNNDIAPKLHLRKEVVNDNGGSKTVADFTLTADGTGANDLSGISPVDSGATLKADTWTLSETTLAGYGSSDWVCVGGTHDGNKITVGIAGEATCTITNDDIAPKLHLRKEVVNDNGGTKSVADFTLTATGTKPSNDLSGTSPVDSGAGLKADTWTLSETTLAGYAASAWDCVGGTQVGNQITVGLASEATCTITNDDIAPKLHLRKEVVNDNGGTKTVADFTLTATGTEQGNDLSGTSPVDSGAGLMADTWTLSETTLPGYEASAWSCAGGSQDGDKITVGLAGEATCTITNDDLAPGLHLRKVVINDNGGTKTVDDFTLTATGTKPGNDLSGTSPVDSAPVMKADTWTLSENTLAGYTASAWSCTGTGTEDGNKITLVDGQSAICTITNDDIAPKLHLRKVVVNDNGGTKTVADFTLTADGTGSNDLTGTSPVDGGAGLKADTWTLSETTVAGYAASAWVCVGGTQDGDKITVGIAGEATCTIINNDIPPKLHLRKVVVNDNSGTKTTGDFVLTALGTRPTNNLSAASPVDSGAGLQADTWSLSESNLAGYAASAWDCVGGSQDGDKITVGIGGEATCTITNDDIAPKLHLRKVVVNDNGGTKTVADFTLTADGTGANDLSGATPVDSGATLKADTWTLSETTAPGYIASAWSCVGGTQHGNKITVGLAGEATCTITNDDIAPKLHLRKVVVSDNGGTKTVADFTLTADGTGSNDLTGTSPVDSGTGLQADTWTLSESAVAGYVGGAWVCLGGVQSTNHVTLGVGEESTCTVVNDDIAPKLHLRKVVVNDNGGTKTVADFTLTADGAGSNDLSGTSPVDSGASLRADAWTLSESAVAGYTPGAWVCLGGRQTANQVTLSVGEEATCTVTNDDIAPKLHLRKVVVNDNGGTKTAAEFTLTADGAGSNDLSGTSPVDSGAALTADTWTLSETAVAGYAASAWSCVGGSQDGNKITVGIGGEATCTITNDDIAPKLHLRKVVVNDNGGTKSASDFTLTADGAGSNDLTGRSPVDGGATLKADTWTLSETAVAGYAASAWSCVGGTQDGNRITVGLAGEATCTITNDDVAPRLHLRKVVVNDSGGTKTVADFTLTADGSGSNDLSGTSPVDSGATLKADTWTLSETNQAGYSAGSWICIGGTQDGNRIILALAAEATCTITNDDVPPPPTPQAPSNPSISITKNPKDQLITSGQTATWSIVVANSGNVTLANVRVTDAQAPGCDRTSASLPALASMAPGASATFTCTRANVTSAFTNVAVAAGTPPSGGDVTASDSANVRVQAAPFTPPPAPVRHPSITIEKNPDSQTTSQGGTATFRITVTNNGDVTLHDVTVTDPLSPDCDRDLGTLAPNASRIYTCTRPGVARAFVNHAAAVGTSPTGTRVRDADSAPVTVAPFRPPSVPKIQIFKGPKLQTITAGGKATFAITVRNTGNVTLLYVKVTDPRSPRCNRSLGTLAKGATRTYTCTKANVKASFTNVANVVGTSPTGDKVTDRDLAQVNIKSPPKVTG